MKKPSENITRKRGKRADLDAWLDRVRPDQIGEAEFDELLRVLAPVSESYLRRLLRQSSASLAPMVAGVRQENFERLEASLLALLEEYEAGDAARRNAIRRIVIAAKDHARLSSRPPARREEKTEMVLWTITWLENPPLFPQWVKLRRARLFPELDAARNQ